MFSQGAHTGRGCLSVDVCVSGKVCVRVWGGGGVLFCV